MLEVGVGTGVVAAALEAGGRSVVGVDLSLPMLRHAHARLGGGVAQADGFSLPVRSGAVDSVVIVWVVHLVPDSGAFLAEAARVVRPRVVASSSSVRVTRSTTTRSPS